MSIKKILLTIGIGFVMTICVCTQMDKTENPPLYNEEDFSEFSEADIAKAKEFIAENAHATLEHMEMIARTDAMRSFLYKR